MKRYVKRFLIWTAGSVLVYGAIVAGLLFPLIGLGFGGGVLAAIIHATIGAVILLYLIRVIKSA